MKKCGTVVDPGGEDSPVLVRPERSASCGSCRACIGAGGGVEPVPVSAPFPVQKGEKVLLESRTGYGILQSVKLFILPLVGFWSCFGLATVFAPGREAVAAGAGVAGFFLVMALIRTGERQKSRKQRYLYRITSRIG